MHVDFGDRNFLVEEIFWRAGVGGWGFWCIMKSMKITCDADILFMYVSFA